MRILFTADWHMDQTNLDLTVPPARWLVENAANYDLFIHGGDVAVHRGMIHPHVAFEIRSKCAALAEKATFGGLIVRGNHDDTFSELHDTLVGIFGTHNAVEGNNRIRLAVRPSYYPYKQKDGSIIGVVAIPSPNKHWLMAYAENEGIERVEVISLLEDVIRGLILEAQQHADAVVVAYHGSVTGARLGNEMTMTSGLDVSVSRSCFDGANYVLAGHIHHHQVLPGTATGPPIAYPGSLAPLTWNEKNHEPMVLLLDTDTWDLLAEPVPVVSQMIDLDLEFGSDNVPGGLTEFVKTFVAEKAEPEFPKFPRTPPRVRLNLKGPHEIVSRVTPKWEEIIREECDLRTFNCIVERTDEATARFAIERKWGIQQALARYIELNDITGDAATELMELSNSFEARVQDSHLDAHYEMKPVRLTAKNWCQYAELVIDFEKDLGNLTAIAGKNNMGKSNAMRAVLFALYKKQVSGDTLNHLVRIPKDKTWLCFDFESGDVLYRSIRELKIAGDGACSAAFSLLRNTGTDWQPINEGTAARTQAWLETKIGPLELFLACCWAGQNDVDGLLNFSPAQMKDLLVGVLQRDFEGRLALATTKRRVLDKEIGASEIVRASTVAAREAVTTTKADVIAKRKLLGEKRAEAEAITLEGLHEKLANLIAEATRVAGLRKEAEGMAREAVRAEADASVALCSAANAVEAGDEAKAIDGRLAILPVLSKLHAAQAHRRAVVDKQEEELRMATRIRTRTIAKKQAALDGANEKMQAASLRCSDAVAKADKLAADFERFEKAASIIDEVPCEGAKWLRNRDTWDSGTERGLEMDGGDCRFLLDAKMTRDELPGLGQRLKATLVAVGNDKRAFEQAEILRDAAKGDLDDYRDPEARAQETEEEALKDNQQDLRNSLAATEDAQRRHDKATSLKERRTELLADAKHEQEFLDEAKHLVAEADILRKSVRALNAEAGDVDMDARLETVKLAIAERDRMKRDAVAEVGLVEIQIARLDFELEEAKRLDILLAENLKSAMELEREQSTVLLYEEAMHRDGIPFLLLEQFAIPQLEALTNGYLAGTNLRVEVLSERELVRGGARNEVRIRYRDHRGIHPISAASGQLRTAIGMALRNAIADLNAEATGSRIWLSVQDEGFGTMDDENIELAKSTLRQIAAKRGWFVFISHVAGMADIADTRVTVTDEQGVATLEVA